MKKSGSALVMALITIMVIFILASSLLSLTLTNYKNTEYIEKRTKLEVIAQSGLDNAYVEMKNYIVSNTSILLEPKIFDPVAIGDSGVLTFTKGNVENKVILESSKEDKITDLETGREYYYIKATSTALDKKTNESSTIVQYIDRKEIYNPYFDRMFNSAFTVVLPLEKRNSELNGSLNNLNSYFDVFRGDLKVSGDIYIQSKNIIFKPSYDSDMFHDTNLYLKGINLDIEDSKKIINKLNGGIAYKDDNKIENYMKYWKQINIKELKNLSFEENLKKGYIKYKNLSKLNKNDLQKGHDIIGGEDVQIFNKTYEYIDYEEILKLNDKLSTNKDKEKGDVKKQPYIQNPYVAKEAVKVLRNDDNNQLLIEFKGKTENGEKIDFNKLINGGDAKNPYTDFAGVIDDNARNNDGIYEHSVEELKKIDKYKTNYMETYGNIYKLILIDGDIIIPDNKKERFINYIIYCTGTVTFEGESEFYNSSIFAKNIVFKQDSNEVNGEYKGIKFNGVNSVKSQNHIVNDLNERLIDFNSQFKGFIHTTLMKSLNGYKEALEFHIIKTEKF